MALIEYALSWWTVAAVAAAVAASYGYEYFVTHAHLRGLPAPWAARVSNLWLLAACRRRGRYRIIDEAHRRLGKVVRIQPNHVSIADDAAIPAIYGHGNGFLKSEFYDCFVSIYRGLFSTRDRAEHARKRKLVSHAFSAKSVARFEPYIHESLRLFVQQLDSLVARSHVRNSAGRPEAHVDCLPWFNYLAFDIIGDLAFGAPFGMLRAGADRTEMRASPESPLIEVSAIQALNRRGEMSATLGCLPALRTYARWLPDPFFTQGVDAVRQVAGIAIARVQSRLESPSDEQREDLLARLMEGCDEKGEPLGRDELTAEALTHTIAGSDTTSNTSCALMYYLASRPSALQRLQAELDTAIQGDTDVPSYDAVKHLEYLEWSINEAMRLHCTSGIGLPREIPPGSPGVALLGTHYPPGTVLSVPTFTMHHSKEIWGDDADDFKPERWRFATVRQTKAFIPFSYGPRACVGKNVAMKELKLIAATWARRYSVELRQGELETREGFLRKPTQLQVALSRR